MKMDDVTALLASPAVPQSNQFNPNQYQQLLLTASISPKMYKNDPNKSMIPHKQIHQEQTFQIMSPDMINKKNQLRLSANMSCLNEFELQIKQLEQQAKNLKDERESSDLLTTASSNTSNDQLTNQIMMPSSNNDNENSNSNFNYNGFNLNDINNMLARSYSNNLVDVRNEENYLKEIR
jgi:hypothetical protein